MTEAQKEYFKYSKMRDINGNLVICRHCTNTEFDAFDKDKITGDSYCGRGFYFTSRLEFGGTFGQHKLDCYLNLENPLILTQMDDYTKYDLLEYFSKSEDYINGYLPRIEGYPQKTEKYDCERLQDMLEYHPWGEEVQQLVNEVINSSAYNEFKESGNIEDLMYSYDFENLKDADEFKEVLEEQGVTEYLEMEFLALYDLDYRGFHYGKWNDFSELLTEFAKENHYDSILLDFGDEGRSTEIVVFEPNQIKSVNNLYPTQSDNFKDNSAEYFKQKGISPLDAKIQMAKDMKAMNTKTNTKEHNKEKERE